MDLSKAISHYGHVYVM